MTRAAVALAVAAAAAADAGAPRDARFEKARTVRSVAPGLTWTSLERGEPVAAKRFVVVAGIERRQRDADRLLERVERLGFVAEPVHREEGYEVRAIGFAGARDAERARAALAAAGLGAASVREIGQDETSPSGPFAIEILEVDPSSVDVVVAHTGDAALGLETTNAIARRRGALAAVNGGYFRDAGDFAGDNQGLLVLGGRLLSEPDRGRAGVGFVDEEGGRDRALFDRLGWCGVARRAGGPEFAIDGIDRPRGEGETVLYTAELGRATPPVPGGVEAVLADGFVREVRLGGGSPIPRDGAVLSFAPWALPDGLLSAGDRVELELRLRPPGGDPEALWARAHSATGGGPLLLAGGRPALAPEQEAMTRVFSESRHPRTAIAARADGTLLLVTVDGRRPERSVGMTLPELARLLLELGASDAVNLDGGGSTTMVIRGETVNRPSDALGERAVGDAILLFPR